MKKASLLPLYFLISLLSGLIIDLPAQPLCGSDILHKQHMENDLAYRADFTKMQDRVDAIISSGESQVSGSRSVYNIPVVVHVIHLGEPEGTGTNISATQIQSAIDGLNDRFINLIGAGLDMGIKFCLASRDPNGCPTGGITRTDGSAIPNYMASGISVNPDTCGDEHMLKNLNKWPVSSYYNIWVVNKICGGWYGYAYFPWGGAYDGAVMRYNAMTYSATTLTHEIGHGFNLFHTFEGDKGDGHCPLDTNCSMNGDKCCDTPPHKQSDCESALPCSAAGIWDNSRCNQMSYCFPSNASARFTQDQKMRVQASMLVYPRANLVNSLGCTPANITCGATDVREMENFSLSVYPNPCVDLITISGSAISNGEYRILLKNILGRTQIDKHEKVENNLFQQVIQLSQLTNGIYFLIIEHGSKRAVYKVNKIS